MLTDSFFCHCTSTEGTCHRQFGKRARNPLIGENIIIFSNMLIFENIYTLLNSIFYFMEPRKKNLQDLRDQNHCKHVGLVNHLAIYHDFHGLKLSYSLKFVHSY